MSNDIIKDDIIRSAEMRARDEQEALERMKRTGELFRPISHDSALRWALKEIVLLKERIAKLEAAR